MAGAIWRRSRCCNPEFSMAENGADQCQRRLRGVPIPGDPSPSRQWQRDTDFHATIDGVSPLRPA